ncbi:transposase [Nocardia sp. NPDC049220]|uniref:transposase n=1 Tax=Nocardia sp. NPDC049220 TaxID=3155273 RepID=UPI0033D60EA6
MPGRESGRHNRLVVEAMLYRLRVAGPWRDLLEVFGKWRTVWKRHRRYAADATWDRVWTALPTLADTAGDLDWVACVDSTIVRVHQHAADDKLAYCYRAGVVMALIVEGLRSLRDRTLRDST